MKHAAALAACMLLIGGCDGADIFFNAAADELRGAPDAERLRETAHFQQSGVAFDYPAVLRVREDREPDGSVEWNLEYGMYTLSLHAPRYELAAQDYLDLLAQLGKPLDDPQPAAGAAMLCGTSVQPARLYFSLLGDATRIEAYDLPAPRREARVLLFQDEPDAHGAPTALATATRERVLASLRCVQ